MRKKVFFFLALLLLFSVGTWFVVKAISAPTDRVIFTQKTLFGSPSAASGLTVIKKAQYREHLLWESTLSFTGSDFDAHTDFSYVPESTFRHTIETQQNLSAYDSMTGSYWSNSSDTPEFGGGFVEAQKALYDATPEGTTGTITVKASDYYEYYPLDVVIELPVLSYFSQTDGETHNRNESPEIYAVTAVKDFLKIPVIKASEYEIDIEKNYGGSVNSINIYPVEDSDHFSLCADSVITDNACFFWFSNRTIKGNPVDCSLIPGGYGIYILPYGQISADNYHGEAHFEGYDVFADELRLFYPLPEDADLLHVSVTEDQSTLLLYLQKDDCLTVTAVDTASGQALSTLVLAEELPNDAGFDFSDENAFFTVYGNDTLILLTLSADRSLQVGIKAECHDFDLDGVVLSPYGGANRVMAYDGEKLVIAADGDDSLGFLLSVFTAEGLQYCGLYDSSLERVLSPDGNYTYRNAVSGSFGQEIVFSPLPRS